MNKPHKTNKPAESKKTSGFAIASLILGILSILLGWFPLFGWIFIILALIFGVIALKQIKNQGLTGRGLAIAGTIMGIIGIILAAILFVKFMNTGKNITSTCSSMDCFIENANACNTTTYIETTEIGTIRYSTATVEDYCGLSKKIIALNSDEDPFLAKTLQNKELRCGYYKGEFNSQWTSSLIEGIEYCEGDLKEAIGQLILLS
ncbi:MAG: DUF4190 domain-containing protein [Nanoarchaeota archaeon]|nr:DUF4190 domain-containing protein [Nanoarchaeota archaeon]